MLHGVKYCTRFLVVTGEAATPSLEFASASLNHLTSKEELDREKHGKTLIVTVSVAGQHTDDV